MSERLWQSIAARADRTPGALFAIDESDRRMTFGAYRERADRTAAGLARLGVHNGTTVAWVLPTGLDALVLYGALSRLGAIQVPLLTAYRERELAFALRQTGAQLLVVRSRLRGVDYAGMAERVVSRGDAATRVLAVDDGALPEADTRALAPTEHGSFIYYTSGTTADPKGVRHTDATLRAAASGLVDALALAPDDRAAIPFALSHIGGALWLIASLLSGCALIVLETFDATAIDALARHGVTQAGAGTVFHQRYLAAQRARPDAPLFPRVRAFPGGGAPKPPELHDAIKRELGGAGIVSGYGLTECPAVTMNRVGDRDEDLARTEGRPSPRGAEVRVVTLDGREARAGEEGEVRVRGPQLFLGYVDAALDAGALDDRGFFETGDLGSLDAGGYLTITGRLKDVIVRKGENISAKEIEDLLYEHPEVTDVAVIGVPDRELGERCCAVVVARRSAAPPTLAALASFLDERGLMRQKIPERVEIVSELPRNALGKLDKRALRARFG